jgi:hypothetical protein
LKISNINSKLLFIVIISISFLFSCEEPDIIGLEVQPSNDKLNVQFTDTNTLTTYSVREDSIRTDETQYNLLGTFIDPVFGQTYASIYTQFRLSSDNVDFGANPVLDSLILTLDYEDFYGSILKYDGLQKIKIYELAQDIYKDSSYYSNKNKSYSTTELANLTFLPDFEDSITIDSERYAPHLRIKLDNSLGQIFLDASGTDVLSDNDQTHFLDFFKGLYITTEQVGVSKGAILYFDLLSTLSKMTLYYKNDENDSLKYDFLINEHCARFNNFNHYDYYDADPVLKQQIIDTNITLGDSILYLQAMGGIKTKIMFPNMQIWDNYGIIAVNKAELIIKVNETTDASLYEPPTKLSLVRINEQGENTFLLDQFEGEEYFGGSYNSARKEYRFVISRYIQDLINKTKTDYGLYLMISGSSVKANRAVLNGSKYSSNNIRLLLTYTKLD